jgi:Bacterial SH3 domain
MKWFLQFLSIGSAVIYTLLIIIDKRIPDGTAENTVASEAQSNQRHLSVWGPYLPYRSFGQDRQASLTPEPIDLQNEALAPEPYSQGPRKYFDGQPASKDKLAASAIDDDQIGKRPASLPITAGSFEPSVPLEGNEAIWFVVSRAARLHAGPSVSSPVVQFYPVGTELKLIGYAQGWFQVLDPATLRQGWIYENYYLQAISGPGQTRVAVQDLPSPRVAYAASKPKPVSRVKKPRSQQKITKPRPQQGQRTRIASARTHNEFASYVERAFRGYR